jgi:hypothetical protein
LIELENGTYYLEFDSTLFSASRGTRPYTITVEFEKSRYERKVFTVTLLVQPIDTRIEGDSFFEPKPWYSSYAQSFNFTTLTGMPIIGANASAFIDQIFRFELLDLGNGTYQLGPFELNHTYTEGPHTIELGIMKANYRPGNFTVEFSVRDIETDVIISYPSSIFVGNEFTLSLMFRDMDNNLPIYDFDILPIYGTPTLDRIDEGWEGELYVYTYLPSELLGDVRYDISFNLTKDDYQKQSVSVSIFPQLTPEQQTVRTATTYGGLAIPALISLFLLWWRVLSVPRTLRKITRMINSLERGKSVKAGEVSDRRQLILDMMNEDLEPVNITKTMDDIAVSTVDVAVLDVEDLLTELAEVVGLTEDDIDILRRDLDKMRPSERAGFIGEVLKQERARRAREIAEAKLEPEVPEAVAELERKLTEEELEHLRERLLSLGISDTEADLMVEQARSLTKAEIDALLDEIGGEEQ